MPRINIIETDELTGEKKVVSWFDPDKSEQFEGDANWDGNNMADVNTGANRGQDLFRTPGGKWVIRQWSNWANEQTEYWLVNDAEAKNWLLLNNKDEAVEKYFGKIEDEGPGPGRPKIGEPFQFAFPAELRAQVEAAACGGESLADTVRRLLEVGAQAVQES